MATDDARYGCGSCDDDSNIDADADDEWNTDGDDGMMVISIYLNICIELAS